MRAERNICRLAAIAAFLALISPAAAQDWPTRPIRAIIPFGAGSATDLVPRIVFDQLSPQLGQPIVVENRTGAGGTLGTNAVAKADPDGYTMLAHSNAFSVSPAIYANLSYDTINDFTPVVPFGSLAGVLIMSPSKGFKTIQEMVAAAKAKPGTFNFASVGVGSGTHLSAEKLKLSPVYEWVYETAAVDSWVSIEKAERVLGFAPKYSNREALIKNYDWYVAHLAQFKGASGISHRTPWKQGLIGLGKKFF